MDVVLANLIQALPGAGVLMVVLVLVLRNATQDRRDYRAELAEIGTRHDADLARTTRLHTAELAALHDEINGLRTQLVEVNSKLDAERDRRRAVEDAMGRRGGELA